MRPGYCVVLLALGVFAGTVGDSTGAVAASRVTTVEATTDFSITDFSAQARSRRPVRVRVTRQARALPPDAVRECQAWYVQEHRPSGTVITPRMQCWWTR